MHPGRQLTRILYPVDYIGRHLLVADSDSDASLANVRHMLKKPPFKVMPGEVRRPRPSELPVGW